MTAYEVLISDWSSDVCSSDLHIAPGCTGRVVSRQEFAKGRTVRPPQASQYRTFPAPSRSTCAVGTEAGRNDIAKLAAGAEAGMVSGSAAARTDRDDPARCCWRTEERRVGKECVRKCSTRW